MSFRKKNFDERANRAIRFQAQKKINFANTNLKDSLLIRNPTVNSNIRLTIFKITAYLVLPVPPLAVTQATIQISTNPGHTDKGTLLTAKPLYRESGATSEAKIYHTPTITGSGTLAYRITGINNKVELPEPLILKTGEEILVRASVSDSNAAISFNIEFGEE